MANQVAVKGRTGSDVIENITIIVIFVKFHVLRLLLFLGGNVDTFHNFKFLLSRVFLQK